MLLSCNLVFSDIISIIAIIISIIMLCVQIFLENKRNRKARITELYNQAYKDLLMNELPLAVSRIKLTDKGLEGTGVFSDVCKRLQKNSGFFQFFDYSFYCSVIQEFMDLEDYVLSLDNRMLDKMAFEKERSKIYKMVKKIYDIILDRCL